MSKSDKFINLFDNSDAFKSASFSPQSQRAQTLPTKKKLVRMREQANADAKGRSYLPSLFNVNPNIVQQMRRIEDPDEIGVVNPTHRAFTGVLIPTSDEALASGAVLKYKKERFEFGKIRPAAVEIDSSTLPPESGTLSPAQRRAIFNSELEKEQAKNLLKHERGAEKKSATLRRFSMPTAVLVGELPALTSASDLSPAQVQFAARAKEAADFKRGERRDKIAFFNRSTNPLPGSFQLPPDVKAAYSAGRESAMKATKDDGAEVPPRRLRGPGQPVEDGLTRPIIRSYQLPMRRQFVPFERDVNIVSGKLLDHHVFLSEDVKTRDFGDSADASPLSLETRTREVIAGTANGTLNRSRSASGTPYWDGMPPGVYRSTNPNAIYPTSSEAQPTVEFALGTQDFMRRVQPVNSSPTGTLLPPPVHEFPNRQRTRFRHYFDQIDQPLNPPLPPGAAVGQSGWNTIKVAGTGTAAAGAGGGGAGEGGAVGGGTAKATDYSPPAFVRSIKRFPTLTFDQDPIPPAQTRRMKMPGPPPLAKYQRVPGDLPCT